VGNHFAKLGFPPDMLALPWFMCFYVGYIPWEASLRVIDLVLSFGTNILFQIGLAIFALSEKKILNVHEEGEKISGIIFESVQDANLLIEVAFTRFAELPYDTIEAMRKQKTVGLVRDLQDTMDEKTLQHMLTKIPDLKSVKHEVLLDIHKHFTEMVESRTTTKIEHQGIDAIQFQDLIYRYVPNLVSAPERNSGIVALCFNTASKDGIMTEEDFLRIFTIMSNGSLVEQFDFCFHLICPRDGTIKKSEFRSVLDILHRIAFNENTSMNVVSSRLDLFVEIVFEKLRGHQETLTSAQVKEMILGTHLLEGFWAQLSYPQ